MAKEKVVYLEKRELAKKLVATFKAETGAKITIDNMVKLLSILGDTVVTELIAGNNIRLQGLFSMVTKDQEEKEGRNPKTGEKITIPAKRVVQLSKSKKLSEAVATGIVPTATEDESEDEVVDAE